MNLISFQYLEFNALHSAHVVLESMSRHQTVYDFHKYVVSTNTLSSIPSTEFTCVFNIQYQSMRENDEGSMEHTLHTLDLR